MLKILNKFNVLKLFVRCLNGEAPLSQAFWLVYVLFGIIQMIVIELIFHRFITGTYITFDVHNQFTDQLILFAFPYLFLSSMCVWSCAKNSWIEWNIFSKIIVVIPLIIASFHLKGVF